jgi:hypothetical protein
MFDLLQNLKSVFPEGLKLIGGPRRFVRDWRSSVAPGASPLFVLACAIGLFGVVTAISNFSGLDTGLNRYLNKYTTEISVPPGGFPSLFKLRNIGLVRVYWPISFGASFELSRKDEITDTYPLALFQVGAFEAVFSNLPAKMFSSKGGQVLLVFIYAISLSLAAHPACLILKGHSNYRSCLSFLTSTISVYFLIFSIAFIFLEILLISVEQRWLLIAIWTSVFVIPFFLLLLRSLYTAEKDNLSKFSWIYFHADFLTSGLSARGLPRGICL